MSTELKWTATKEGREQMADIADRAMALLQKQGYKISAEDKRNLIMDLNACHANGNPLDFAKLAEADDFNFSHDVFGIQRHIDRNTGRLRGCFLPRCSA